MAGAILLQLFTTCGLCCNRDQCFKVKEEKYDDFDAIDKKMNEEIELEARAKTYKIR